MWNEALILLIAQMSCLPIRLRPSLHRSEHRCRLIGANAHDYLMVYDIYVIEPIGFHSSPTLTFCPFSAPTAQRPEETQEKGTRSLASVETDYLNVTPWIEIGDWVVSEGCVSLPSSSQIAAVDEDGREDKATIKCETSPPPTPRTVRMTHTLPASSHNDARG